MLRNAPKINITINSARIHQGYSTRVLYHNQMNSDFDIKGTWPRSWSWAPAFLHSPFLCLLLVLPCCRHFYVLRLTDGMVSAAHSASFALPIFLQRTESGNVSWFTRGVSQRYHCISAYKNCNPLCLFEQNISARQNWKIPGHFTMRATAYLIYDWKCYLVIRTKLLKFLLLWNKMQIYPPSYWTALEMRMSFGPLKSSM
jgi:hypothetical protein